MVKKRTAKRLRLNPKFNKTLDTNLHVWSHDENSYEFRFEFYDDECDMPIDLTGANGKILLLFKNDEDKKHLLNLDIEDETLGLAKFIVPKRILGYQGVVNAHIYIDFEGKTHDFGNFLFRMKRSAIDEDFPELDTVYVSEFEKALEEIQEILRKFDGVEMDIDEKIKQIEQAIEQHELEVEQKLNDINTSVDDRLTQINNNLDGTEEELNKRIDVIEKDIASNEIAKQKEVNEIKKEVFAGGMSKRNMIIKEETLSKAWVNNDGNISSNVSNAFTTGFIRVLYGETYTTTQKYLETAAAMVISAYDEDKNFINRIEYSNDKYFTFKINDPSIKFVRYSGRIPSGNYEEGIKIEAGSKPTPWSPASEDIVDMQKQIDELKKAITTLGGTL